MTQRRNPWGTVFLVVAAVGFLIVEALFRRPFAGSDFVRAFFEASLVGALADWFAVTALFRRPLGLPLPHTDLLVRKKASLVRALPQFLGGFLESERLDPVLRSVDWAGLILEKVTPDDADRWIEAAVKPWILGPEAPPARWEQALIRWVSAALHRELSAHREMLVGPVTDLIKKNAGWKGFFVSRETIDDVISGVLAEMGAVRDDENHPFRGPAVVALRQALPRFLEDWRPSQWSRGWCDRVRSDPAFHDQVNRRASELAIRVVEQTHARQTLMDGLGYLLEQTDARALAGQVEQAVWNDLQYIRVNGALVGGLAGLALQGLHKLFFAP